MRRTRARLVFSLVTRGGTRKLCHIELVHAILITQTRASRRQIDGMVAGGLIKITILIIILEVRRLAPARACVSVHWLEGKDTNLGGPLGNFAGKIEH
jgi:hypothetical protein